MAQFPVSDDQSLQDAVNYLLSGPSGLGQYFQGFSAYLPGYVTGNFRRPYNSETVAYLYVAPINLSTSEMLDGRTYKFTFASTQPSIPFVNGNGPTVSDTSDPWYNDSYTKIGVVECTTTYCIVRVTSDSAIVAPATGGTIQYYSTDDGYKSTQCNARVTVNGGTDRVFVSGQLDNIISYTNTGAPATLTYSVAIRRWVGFVNPDPINPDYLFDVDATVAEKIYTYTLLTGSGTLPLVETVFTTILDVPPPGYYWYILEVKFNQPDSPTYISPLQVTTSETKLRSLSVQVVKQ